MKAYIATTGVLFGLVTISHVVRALLESHLTRDPFFLVATVIACVLSVWALRLLIRARTSTTHLAAED